jgi:hypothetical protein
MITGAMRATIRGHANHENANIPDIGKDEAQHRKYKMLNGGGCQTYDS